MLLSRICSLRMMAFDRRRTHGTFSMSSLFLDVCACVGGCKNFVCLVCFCLCVLRLVHTIILQGTEITHSHTSLKYAVFEAVVK